MPGTSRTAGSVVDRSPAGGGRPVRVGVVTVAHGRHEHLRHQHRALARSDRLPDDYVVVAMGDPEITSRVVDGLPSRVVPIAVPPDGRLPLAAARNRGAREVIHAGADVVVFLDVDCLPGRELVAAYADAAQRGAGVLWSGPVTYLPPGRGGADLDRLDELDDPHPARPAPARGELVTGANPDLFWSLSFAVSAEGWARVGGFCEEYTGYGGEDTDFGRSAVAAGLDLGWVGGARAYHQHHPVESPPVRHLDDILRNGALFHERWGEWPMRGWLSAFEEQGLVRRTADGWARA
ncbi:galactosyltransferase-related protein [Nocardioides sp. IC4_145]|uniref:glycosyltransferase family 2 protein n=1 Tax=Nocardioides sp. IC4_145 TaxID=2714037 RepID=UPI001A983F89|nr:galactosyltransferase-related protein [Nocardioides sp. IC4_145]